MNTAAAPKNNHPESLVQAMVQSVLTYIRDNQLKVGDRLPSENDFARDLAVSRTVVREAFRALAAMRIIDSGAGRRARVCEVDSTVMALSMSHALQTRQVTVQQVWDVRRSIEMRAVQLACVHRSDAEARRIVELTTRMAQTYLDLPTMTENDIEFHIAIARSSGNPLFPILISSLTTAMRETNPMVWQVRTREAERLEVLDWHVTIARAVEARDQERAREAMSRHFDDATRSLVNAGFN